MKSQLLLLLSGLLALGCVQGARVYMQFNGKGYAYNTDGDRTGRSAQSPKYGQAAGAGNSLEIFGPYNTQPTADSLATASLSRGYQIGSSLSPSLSATPRTAASFDFSTHQMSHAQHTDESGTVLGKYSYYDEAGYHELSYKAGAGIGFVVMGGNLAKATSSRAASALNPSANTQQFQHKYGGTYA
ncbi:uncharacterized protein LOC117586986 isoform X1 [Drosophila guanche]|uniref:Uncharacterized protein n=1 Tax=Drosophila guanche TaxID=7266 RepID=A0A3B0KAP8_DROGU|nr:uncharacterized protein LOC117586986 isoform X1 [Drosophila guanche]SPP85200.1 Hypothetical predicted protein [Drosophila guanche]